MAELRSLAEVGLKRGGQSPNEEENHDGQKPLIEDRSFHDLRIEIEGRCCNGNCDTSLGVTKAANRYLSYFWKLPAFVGLLHVERNGTISLSLGRGTACPSKKLINELPQFLQRRLSDDFEE